MTVLREMFANELPTAIYFCATAVTLAVYAMCALSLLRPAPALAARRRPVTRARAALPRAWLAAAAERRFHVTADLHGYTREIIGDVVPSERGAERHVTREPDVLRQAERQLPAFERTFRRRLPAPDAEPAFAVKDFA